MAETKPEEVSIRQAGATAQAGTINLKEFSDEKIRNALALFDLDNSGEVDATELIAGANALKAAKESAQFFRTALIVASIGFVVILGILLGMMMAANELSKENHTKAPSKDGSQPSMLVDKNNKPVAVASRPAQSNHKGIMDMVLMSDKELKEVKEIAVPIKDPKSGRISDFGANVVGYMRHNTESIEIFLSVQDRSLIIGDAKTGAAVYNIDKTVKLADVVVNKADVEKRAKEEAAKREAAKKAKGGRWRKLHGELDHESCAADPSFDPCIMDDGSVNCHAINCAGTFCEDKYYLDCAEPGTLGGSLTLVHSHVHEP